MRHYKTAWQTLVLRKQHVYFFINWLEFTAILSTLMWPMCLLELQRLVKLSLKVTQCRMTLIREEASSPWSNLDSLVHITQKMESPSNLWWLTGRAWVQHRQVGTCLAQFFAVHALRKRCHMWTWSRSEDFLEPNKYVERYWCRTPTYVQ